MLKWMLIGTIAGAVSSLVVPGSWPVVYLAVFVTGTFTDRGGD